MSKKDKKAKISPYGLPYLREYFLSLENNNYSQKTLKNYRRDLEILSAFLFYIEKPFKELEKLDLIDYKGFLRNQNYIPVLHAYQEGKELKQEVIEKSQNDISEKKKALYKGQLSDSSVNRMLSAFRSYLKFLQEMDKETPLDPTAITMIKAGKKEKRVAELEELIDLIEYPSEAEDNKIVAKRNRAILELIFSTGMRISEVVNLDKTHIKTDASGMIIDNKMFIEGKGKKERFVYLTDRAIFYLNEYLRVRKDDYPAMFVPIKGTRKATENPLLIRLSQNYIQSKIKEYRQRVGIVVPTSAHSLRHGFATYLAEEGANPAAIQRLLGHSSLQTTSRYVHSSDRFAEKTHRENHPLR